MHSMPSTSRFREATPSAAASALELGLPTRLETVGPEPARDWAASGAMALTGEPHGPPLLAPAAFATALAHAVARLAERVGDRAGHALRRLDAAALLGERAAASGFARAGATSPGGGCRLLATATWPIALQLAREDDERLLEAWLETERPEQAGPGRSHEHENENWTWLATELEHRDAHEVVARGREIGLAVAAAEPPPAKAPPWVRIAPLGRRAGQRAAQARARVVDLSSLWAGPLCGHLLGLAGAQVIKVESTARPDGARRGPAAFYDLLNGGKASVALDFGREEGRRQLRALIASADVVIEASRPRALEQLGIDAERCVRERPGTTWISLTGYGREVPARGWVAFGDDATVAAGTSEAMRRQTGHAGFCGDALADPLTGVHAALAGWASYRAGGGHLLDLSLHDVTAAILVDAPMPSQAVIADRDVAPPRLRRPAARAAELGADTTDILRQLPC